MALGLLWQLRLGVIYYQLLLVYGVSQMVEVGQQHKAKLRPRCVRDDPQQQLSWEATSSGAAAGESCAEQTRSMFPAEQGASKKHPDSLAETC